MMEARNHRFDCVLVWKLDRFARSTKHLLTALEEFNYLGIRFVSIQDQVDTTSPYGKSDVYADCGNGRVRALIH